MNINEDLTNTEEVLMLLKKDIKKKKENFLGNMYRIGYSDGLQFSIDLIDDMLYTGQDNEAELRQKEAKLYDI